MIDIFAGPGGLGEGFSSFEIKPGSRPFGLEVSAEMEGAAHATLRLRAFYRLLRDREGRMPRRYLAFLRGASDGARMDPAAHFGQGPLSDLWKSAEAEALNLTLGNPAHNDILHERVATAKRTGDPVVLIGGPPCQAYSLVGRSRNANVRSFKTKGDERHFLYRQYLEILAKYSPDAFIMENVKGILSSTVGGRSMFRQIHGDLSNPAKALGLPRSAGATSEYILVPVHLDGDDRDAILAAEDPKRFIVRCEHHGAPQARHRVIIMGVRADHEAAAKAARGLTRPTHAATLGDALSGLPRLRSGLSQGNDSTCDWLELVEKQRRKVARSLPRSAHDMRSQLESLRFDDLPRTSKRYAGKDPVHLGGIRHPEQDVVLNHETRGHMPGDLGRYLYCATFGKIFSRSPTSADFPRALAPDHVNWDTGSFADRFRVQLLDRPSSTVTSHLSKDGHAFIHPDPAQCRSLTVREAARLQTFPDDYLFLGNRTQQFVQVGNAVPPRIAGQIAKVIWSIVANQGKA